MCRTLLHGAASWASGALPLHRLRLFFAPYNRLTHCFAVSTRHDVAPVQHCESKTKTRILVAAYRITGVTATCSKAATSFGTGSGKGVVLLAASS